MITNRVFIVVFLAGIVGMAIKDAYSKPNYERRAIEARYEACVATCQEKCLARPVPNF